MIQRATPKTPKDEEELKQLIPIIYRHIMSLNFPPISPDADRTLKDIRAFINELVLAST